MITYIAHHFKHLVTIEDNTVIGGFSSAVLEVLADQSLSAEVLRIGIPDEFVEHGKLEILLDYLNMDAVSVVETIVTRWPDILGQSRELELLKFGKS